METKSKTPTGTITIDNNAKMGYCQFLYGRKIAKTIENNNLIEDYDREGNLIGYEFCV